MSLVISLLGMIWKTSSTWLILRTAGEHLSLSKISLTEEMLPPEVTSALLALLDHSEDLEDHF